MNTDSEAWTPLEDGTEYKMAILDFIFAGGDGYAMVQAGSRYTTVLYAVACLSRWKRWVLVQAG
jgi:hypothetical protein